MSNFTLSKKFHAVPTKDVKITDLRKKILEILRPYPLEKIFCCVDEGNKKMTVLRKKNSKFVDPTSLISL